MILNLLKTIAAKHLQPGAPKPVRTATPMRLSQDSAVTISLTPIVLAEAAGGLFKSDFPTDHRVYAVGRLGLFGMTFYRCYLSNAEGGFIQFAVRGDNVLETRLFRRYDEVYPGDAQAWAFWLADADGYIGYPVMQAKDADGGIQYQRAWNSSEQRIDPQRVYETIVDATGSNTTARHQMMQYRRALSDGSTSEFMLVSAVETDEGASVTMWLGLDISGADLTVFAATDAPQFSHA